MPCHASSITKVLTLTLPSAMLMQPGKKVNWVKLDGKKIIVVYCKFSLKLLKKVDMAFYMPSRIYTNPLIRGAPPRNTALLSNI